jgi:hypothetical protein
MLPRVEFGLAHMGQGNLLVAGGADAAGVTQVLEVYQTDLPHEGP